jgi:hypothetical protein
MIELSDSTINARARLADALAAVIDADPRVRRWRRVEFAEDGGAMVVIELHRDPSGIAGSIIARELEFAAQRALPKLPWVRVQLG